jgi:hypothetical protein
MNRDGPRTPTAIHSALGQKCYPLDKANTIADCLKSQFTPYDMCDKNHEWQVEGSVQAELKAVDKNPPPQKIKTINLNCINKLPNTEKGLRRLPRRPLIYLMQLISHCIWFSHFPTPCKEAKMIALPKPDKNLKFLRNLRPFSLLATTGNLFEKVI